MIKEENSRYGSRSSFCSVLLLCSMIFIRPVLLNGQSVPLAYYQLPKPLNENSQILLSGQDHWQSYIAQYPSWQAYWNEITKTPQRAFGKSIKIEGFDIITKANVESAGRVFIRNNNNLFGCDESSLRLLRADFLNGKWYVTFQQFIQGIPVYKAYVELRISSDGYLFAFGSNCFHDANATNTRFRITESQAKTLTIQGVDPASTADKVNSKGLIILPIIQDVNIDYRLCYRFWTASEKSGEWDSFVDATNGEILWQKRLTYGQEIQGTIRAKILPQFYNDTYQQVPFKHAFIEIDGTNTGYTDDDGNFSISVPQNGAYQLLSPLTGRFANVLVHGANTPTTHQLQVQTGVTSDWTWDKTIAMDDEISTYYHVTETRNYLKLLDPMFTGMDWSIQVVVRDPTEDAIKRIAYYSRANNDIHFAIETANYRNPALFADVIIHEYFHAVTDMVYNVVDDPPRFIHEGMSDYFAASITADSRIGDGGLLKNDIQLRDIDVDWRYPDDYDPDDTDGYHNGLILAAAFWDLRNSSLGQLQTDRLAHVAKYGFPMTYQDYLTEVLIADDNDADLSNGTPNSVQILAAFGSHGITNTVYTLEVRSELSAIPADGSSTTTIIAEVKNSSGTTVPTVTTPVLFSITSGSQSATLIGTNPSIPTEGMATITLQSTETPGEVSIQASAVGILSGAAQLKVFNTTTTVGGPITANTTWDLAGSPYEVTSDVTVYNRAILTIEPGVTVLFHSGTQLRMANGNNAGSLVANGTQANPILFTSFSGSNNDWKGIVFDDGSDNGVTSSMTWSTVEKAGQNNSYNIPAELYFRRTSGITISNSTIGLPISESARGVYSIYCTESSPTISNNTINSSGGNALFFLTANSSPSVSNNTVRGSGNPYWIYAENNNCNPTLSGNTFTGMVTTPLRVGPMAIISGNIFSGTFTPGIEIIAGVMSESRTWSKQVGSSEYVVVAGGNRNDLHVFREGEYPVLTIESGIVVKFAGTGLRIASQGASSFLRYPGGLLINGTSAEPVRLTSYSGGTGGWRGVTFDRDSDVNISSALSYCTIENAGQANSFGLTAALHFFGSRNSVTMTNCTIQSNSGSSLSMNESSISFTKGKINQNSAYPVVSLSGSSLTLTHTEIKNDFSGGEAILNLAGGSYANLDNNEIAAMGGPYWIRCEDNASNVDLYGNTFGGAVSHPLRMGPNSNILGNTFTGSFLSGMEIIAGTIASSRTWSKQNGDSVYVIVSGGAANDLHIYREGGRPILTIESGIVVRFAGTGLRIGSFGASSFLRYPGGLVVNGTTDQPVKFTSLTGNRSGWKGIIFDRDSDSNITSSLSFCIIENAGQGNFFNSNAAIYFRQTSGISLNNCTVQNNGGYGIHTNASSPHVANSLITNNGIHGIFVEGNSRPIIGNSLTAGNDIYGNNLYDLYNSSANTIEARYNYWGTIDRNQIANRIFDKADNPAFGEVFYEPWTDSSHVSILPDNLPPVNPDRALAWSDNTLLIQLFEGLSYSFPNPHFAWRAATDNSLISGYAVSFTPDSTLIPPPTVNVRDTFYTVQQPLIADRTFYLRLRARDGAGNWSAPSTLFRYHYAPQENQPPSTPTALLPENGTELRPDGLLVWTEAKDPDFGDHITYSLHIDDDSTFSTPIIDVINVEGSGISASSLAEDGGGENGTRDDTHHDAATNVVAARLDTLVGYEQLRDDTIYFWRVQARDHRGGVSAFSTARSFFFNKLNTAPGPVTDGLSPRAGLEVRTSHPTLSWHTAKDPDLSDHAGTLRYHLELNTANNFSAPRFNYTTQPGIASIEIPDSLAENARWFWRVRTRDAGDLFSAWSTIHDFWVNAIDEPPLPFTLIEPANHALVTSETIEFRWQATVDPDPQDRLRYIYEFSSDSLFRSHQQRLALTDTSHTASLASLQDGTYYWRVQCIDSDSLITWASATNVTPWRFEVRIVDVDDGTGGLPTTFALQQNYPNPFNPKTRILFSLPQASQVRLEVHNLLGQRIAVLLDESRAPGEHALTWHAVDASGRRVPSGIYILSLHASDPASGHLRFAQTRKMVVVE